MSILRIEIPQDKIVSFCQKWKIREFSIFGSALRNDFNASSDIDVLVEFEPEHGWSLYEIIDMEDELKKIFGRDVDLSSKSLNPPPLPPEE